MPRTTISRSEKKVEGAGHGEYETVQFVTTIPKDLAEAFGIEGGEEVEWKAQNDSLVGVVQND